jgi:type IV fimbrial biogenesis protein FimT
MLCRKRGNRPFVAGKIPLIGIQFTALLSGVTTGNMKKQRGFTLLELLMTLVIASLVMTLAVPSMRDLLQNNRITGQVNEMVTAFNLARMGAIRRGAPVSVCASKDQDNCSGANDWATGWIVFADTNSAGNPANPTAARLIRAWDQLPGNPTVSAGSHFVRYQSDGTTGTAFTVTHTIPDCSGMQKRTLGITPGGRVGGVTRDACQ